MSGQTYTTTIRIPTAQELAARVAADARAQGVASASAFPGQDAVQAVAQLRAEALRFVVETVAPLAKPLAGTVEQRGRTGAAVEMAVGGARVPVRVDVDPARPGAGRLTLAFDHAHGLACAEEARIAAELTALFACAAVQAPDGGASAAADRSAAREAAR